MSDTTLLRSICHELVRISEHQSEMLAIMLHEQDREHGLTIDSVMKYPWNTLAPEERAVYRTQARTLMAERSMQG